jgi:hypothetical protein
VLGLALILCLTPAAFAAQGASSYRMFPTPEDAVKALVDIVKAGKLDDLVALFGPEGRDLVETSDPATGRRNRQVFLVAAREGWRLADTRAGRKELVVGNEDWPFPIPLVKEAGGWRFDTAAGKEEVIARRIGRNELAVIGVCQTFVTAQRAYAAAGHDGKPSGLYARKFASDPGTQNGLYWPTKRGEPRSPLGDLLAAAGEDADARAAKTEPSPFFGYQFRLLTAQGAAAPGGALDYMVNGELSKGFALLAWPAHYDETGVMSFMVNQDGIVFEKDLGPDTPKAAGAITRFNPDSTWRTSEAAPAKP